MCGIAGLCGSFHAHDKEKAIANLSLNLAHRGPDGHGVHESDTVALIHTRLSIIDLSANGNQPLYNEDKSLVLICNGEIYNYKEIRELLVKRGHKFSSNSDSEVVLHLYEEHKDEPAKMLNMLTGMFAFALWDVGAKKLFIARDRIGIKPLYYSFHGGKFVFSSEVKPIGLSGVVPATTDYTSIYEYFLTGFIPGPHTIYKEVKSLAPGHYLILQNDSLETREYWDIPKGLKKWESEQQVQAAVEQLLSAIVKDHLVADVPVGTFLSAGVDSSLITELAVQHHPGIHSFTAAFPGEPEDEGGIAAASAARLKTTHHSFELTSNFFGDFTEQFKDIDQPLAISSALSLGRISQMARKYVKVVLSGDGADELFGGYSRHTPAPKPAFLDLIPKLLRNDLLKLGAKVTGKKSLDVLRKSLQITEGEEFLIKITATEPEIIMSLFTPEVAAKIDTTRFQRHLDALFDKRKGEDELNRTLYVDVKTTLVDEMLTKCDRMTMINGIEGRVPFLDHRMVELAFSIPAKYKKTEQFGKIVLRKMLTEKLGSELAYRVKTGFNSPLQQWLTQDKQTIEFVKKEFNNAGNLGFINKKTIEGYKNNPGNIRAGLVFAIICLNHFLQDESININQ